MALFSTEEYKARVSRVRQSMQASGIDVAIISEAANMTYLTGYAETAYYHKTFVVICVDDEDPYWIGREYTNAPAARLTSYLPENRILTYGEEFATHSSHALGETADEAGGNAMSFVADLFEERGWSSKVVGLEFSSRLLPYEYGLSLAALLPNATLKNISSMVDRCRMVKSDAEITLMREAGVIAEQTMARCVGDIEEGVRECDVAANIFHSLVAGTSEFGGYYPEGVLFNVGKRVPAQHTNWTDQPIEPNQLINVEIGGTRYGYCVGITRPVVIGDVSSAIHRLVDIVYAAFDDMLSVAVAGNTCADLANVFAHRFDEAGIQYRPWMGYGMGLGLPGQNWGEPVGIRRADNTVLEPNMTLHHVPNFWVDELDGWALIASETFRIRDDGPPELLANFERSLFRK